MRQVQKLAEGDFDDFVAITAHAYPGMRLFSAQDRERYKQNVLQMNQDPDLTLFGLFEDERLLGGIGIHDFTMRLHSARVMAGGLDMVAVDVMRKKEKVARDMTAFFLDYCRKNDYALAMLYPFRPDFYKRMGFGYGPKINQYRVRPASLPRGSSKAHVHMLQEADKPALLACYNRYAAGIHGMIERTSSELDRLFDRSETRYVGYKEGDQIRGYFNFSFRRGKEDNWLINDMIVREFVYESREALAELLAFLHSQLDQVRYVVFHLHDDHFHYLLYDPRNDTDNIMWPVHQECNVQGLGLMYRVVDVRRIFERLHQHNFGGVSLRLGLVIRDSFVSENDGRVVVHFENGTPRLADGGATDVTLEMDISDFSSLLMGVVGFQRLYDYGLAQISDAGYVAVLNKLFEAEKPVCLTVF